MPFRWNFWPLPEYRAFKLNTGGLAYNYILSVDSQDPNQLVSGVKEGSEETKFNTRSFLWIPQTVIKGDSWQWSWGWIERPGHNILTEGPSRLCPP